MTVRRLRLIRRALQLFQGAFVVLAVLVLVRAWAFGAEPDIASFSEDDGVHVTVAPGSEFPTVEQFSSIWRRDLRQQLHDPPPKKATPPPKPTPKTPVTLPRLLATFVGDSGSWGLFHGKGGTRVYPVGGTLDGLEIVAVDSGVATLRVNKNVYEVRVPQKATAAKRAKSGRRG